MPDSIAATATRIAQALPPHAGNEAPTSSSLAQVEPFNSGAHEAFTLYLENRRPMARERVTASEKLEFISWLTERWPDKNLSEKQKKKRLWVKEGFLVENGKLYRHTTKRFEDPREVITEEKIWDTVVTVHNNLGHAGQEITSKRILQQYYGIARVEIIFLLKLCEICHRKASSKSKGPLKSIITKRLFERVQVDLIDMTATPDGDYVWICHMEDHFSKFHMLFPMKNKEASTVARCIHHWIAVLGIFEILQSDNGSEFKGICLELMTRYGITVINGRPRTPRTQGLIEQANGVVKARINAWKRTYGSSHWADSLEVSVFLAVDIVFISNFFINYFVWDMLYNIVHLAANIIPTTNKYFSTRKSRSSSIALTSRLSATFLMKSSSTASPTISGHQ